MSHSSSKQVIAVTGGKGGVGKTNVAVNLSLSMARQGKSVLLFDADLGLANVDLVLGLRPKWNVSHVLSGEHSLREILINGPAVDGPGSVQVIPASSGLAKMARLGELELAGLVREFSQLETDFDTLVVDTGAGLDPSVLTFCGACQDVVVVICDEPASLADAYALIKVLHQDCGVQGFQILANMVEGEVGARRLFARLCAISDRFLDVRLQLLGGIPQDEYLRKAVRNRAAVVQAYPRSASAEAFKDAATRLIGIVRDSPGPGGIAFFLEQLIEPEAARA